MTIQQKILYLIPPLGIMLFIGLYVYSSTLYPGGSQADSYSPGFDWINNYWCNLMNKEGMNGITNPARPFAILAMVILCFSLTIFFIQFARNYARTPFWKRMIFINGILSMLFAVLIFTRFHDVMTIISSCFGLFVVIGIIWELYKGQLTVYKISGLCCILLLIANNFIYYSGNFIEGLPLLQKITFAIVLLWIVGLNRELSKQNY